MINKRTEDIRTGTIAILGAGKTLPVGTIRTERTRTLTVTCRVTYNSAATKGITVKLYYTHEDIGLDTVPYTSFVPTFSAGKTVQRTIPVEAPEGQEIEIKVTNDEVTHSATNIIVGTSIMRWEK